MIFRNRQELTQWLKAYSYEAVGEEHWDDPNYEEWMRTKQGKQYLLKVAKEVFDDSGKLRIVTPEEWDPNWIQKAEYVPEAEITDDEVPF